MVLKAPCNPQALLKRERDRNEVLYLKQASFFINECLLRRIWSAIRCMLTSLAFLHFSSKYIHFNAFLVLCFKLQIMHMYYKSNLDTPVEFA